MGKAKKAEQLRRADQEIVVSEEDEVPQPENVEINTAQFEAAWKAWNGVGVQFYSNANLVSIKN